MFSKSMTESKVGIVQNKDEMKKNNEGGDRGEDDDD